MFSQFPLTFQQTQKRDAPFHRIAYTILVRADWNGPRHHLRDVPWENIFKLSTSVVGGEFFDWVQVGIDVYIRHRKYQVEPYSSPWFSAACTDTIAHRNNFFRLYQKNKSSESNVKFRQATSRCERFLEASKLANTTKTKESITSQNLALETYGANC